MFKDEKESKFHCKNLILKNKIIISALFEKNLQYLMILKITILITHSIESVYKKEL